MDKIIAPPKQNSPFAVLLDDGHTSVNLKCSLKFNLNNYCYGSLKNVCGHLLKERNGKTTNYFAKFYFILLLL